MRKLLLSFSACLAAGLLFAGSGCSSENKKEGHLKQGAAYFAAGDYEKADIEYRNVLQLEPLNPVAVTQLGIIYFDQGRLSQITAYLIKGKELQPQNLQVRAKLGLLYLATRRFKEAHDEAVYILDRDPKYPDAALLLLDSAADATEVAAVQKRLEAQIAAGQETADARVALGTLDLRNRKYAEARAAFDQALVLDPKSSAAYAALSNLYRAQNNVVEMEKALLRAAEVASAHSPRKLLYPKFLIQSGRGDDARTFLQGIIKETPDNIPALITLADFNATEQKYDESTDLLNKALARDPGHPEALLLRARVKLAQGKKVEALEEMEKIAKAYPQSAQVQYQLGMAQYASGDRLKAEVALNQALAIAPNYAEAILLLGDLNLKQGNFGAVIDGLTPLAKERPEIPLTRIMLGQAYRAQGNFDAALNVYRELEKSFPKNPQGPYLIGSVLLQQNQRAKARQAFTHALELSPQFLVAIDQLTNLDLAEKNYPAATSRVDTYVTQNPTLAGGYLLRAKVALAQADQKGAETALLKAIELRPEIGDPYLMLARVYLNSGQTDKALEKLLAAAERSPRNVEVLMTIGSMYEQQKDYKQAREYYEKVLAVEPKFGPALNNLAYLFSEPLNDQTKALELGQKAREVLPHDPNVADTLGWIFHQNRQYARAAALLQESADKLPDSAEIQFHLGMTYYMMGDEPAATAALQRALKLNPNFASKQAAQDGLAVLAVPADAATASQRDFLEKSLKTQPADPIALVRLAAIQERAGDRDKAIDSYQKALKASPNHAQANLALIRLYVAEKDSARALELARNLRKISPDDPEVAAVLGKLAYQAGDYGWSFSLLQEAAQKKPADKDLLYELAESAYSVGRVDEAGEIARRALQGSGLSLRAEDARRLLALIAISTAAKPASGAPATVEAALKANPNYAPALMADAVLAEQRGDRDAATAGYEKLFKAYPEFSPARRQLAIFYAEKSNDLSRAYDLAIKSAAAFPDDAELAKATGIILYRQKEYNRAAGALENARSQRPDDAEVLYYLGLTQLRANKASLAKENLQRALTLNLRSDLKPEAQKALAEIK